MWIPGRISCMVSRRSVRHEGIIAVTLVARPRPEMMMSNPLSVLPSSVVIREVGLRDGLQSIATILPTEQKQEWIHDAHAAGLREIEVGSFVPARLLPQLADTAKVLAYAKQFS